MKTLQEQLEKVKQRITDIETQNQNLSRQQGMLDKAKKTRKNVVLRILMHWL